MGAFSLKMILILAAGVLLGGCSNAPVEYSADNPGPILHYISTDPAEIFRNKVDHEAELEARGVEPPVGNASWRDFWLKMIAYWSGPETGFGTQRGSQGANFTAGGRELRASRSREAGDSRLVTREQVTAYISQQRRARGLPSL
jgi:hypothetical protein